MAEIEILDYHFPVCAVNKETRSTVGLYGTAWAVSDRLLFTAGHVLESAASMGTITIGRKNGHSIDQMDIVADYQVFRDHDLGIILSKRPLPGPFFDWNVGVLPLLTDVQACGFPYGYDPSDCEISVRAFKGHIVASHRYKHGDLNCPIFELSFHCPRGISGAPLVEGAKVVGFISGNRITEQEVYSERERDGSTVYSKVEAMHLGVAIQLRPLLSLKPRFFDSTLQKHLEECGRLAAST